MPRLQVLEGPQEQASDETIIWTFDWTDRIGSQSISSATARVVQKDNDLDVSATALQGGVTVASPLTSVTVKSLQARKKYRLTVTAVLSGGMIQDADLLLEAPH